MSDNVEPTPDSTPKGEIPEWARKEISEANSEAAAKRVALKTANEALATANTQIQTLTTQMDELKQAADTSAVSLLKLNVAIKAGVPGEDAAEFAELLQGTTEQELTDYANKLRKFNGGPSRPAYDPSQGRGTGDNNNAPLTPEQEFEAMLSKYIAT